MRPEAHRCLPGAHHRQPSDTPANSAAVSQQKSEPLPSARAPGAGAHQPLTSSFPFIHLSLQHPKRRIVHHHRTNPLTGTSFKPRQGQ